MRYADVWFVRVNLLLLLVVSFLPFPTKLVAEAIASTSAERVAVLFYGATLLVMSVIVAAMGRGDRSSAPRRRSSEVLTVVALADRASASACFCSWRGLRPQLAAFGLLAVAAVSLALPPRLVRRRRRS
jgi:uncharacterized membrane protein